MSHTCGTCSRQLAACEWCGDSGYLKDAADEWPVTTMPEWDGVFHEPCRAAYEQALKPDW